MDPEDRRAFVRGVVEAARAKLADAEATIAAAYAAKREALADLAYAESMLANPDAPLVPPGTKPPPDRPIVAGGRPGG